MRSLSRAPLPLRIALAASLGALAGCGYTEQQWQVQVDKTERERTRRDAAEDRLEKIDAELEEERSKATALEQKLASHGIDPTGAAPTRAKGSDDASAQKLEAARARFEALRARLSALAIPGLTVGVRKNRIVITVPGDPIFEGGKDKLKKDGKDGLRKIAEALRSDPSLAARDFQIAAHTDSKRPDGVFGDNLTLSSMRARQVVLFFTDPAEGKLPKERWSAAGYGDHDPLVPNDTDEGRKANRRLEIVLVAGPDEGLDLRGVAPAAPAVAAPAPAPSPIAAPPPPPPAPPAKAPAPPASEKPAGEKPAPKKEAPKKDAPKGDAPKPKKEEPAKAPPKKAPPPAP
jgi:chemotaxis protein MotB